MSDLQIFNFGENQVRTLMIDNEPWFVAKDVCDILALTNSRKALASIEQEDKKGVTISDTPGGTQTMTAINESGLYHLIFKSRKPEAKEFKRWVTSEVLPSIRKTGSYSIKQLSPGEQIVEMGKAIISLEQEQARQAQELEQTKETSTEALSTAQEAKEGLENVRDELASLKEFAVAQPEGLNQDKGQLINEAFQKLGNVFRESGEAKAPDCYKKPWNELGIKMRNSSVKYDLNSRFSNAMRKFNEDLEKWEAKGKPRGQKPEKPTRITILMRDNKLTDAFKAAQQVVKANISQLTSLK